MTSANSNDFIILYRQSKKKFYKILSTVQVEDGRIFYVDERIAAGGNAVVHKCIEKLSGDIFAILYFVIVCFTYWNGASTYKLDDMRIR